MITQADPRSTWKQHDLVNLDWIDIVETLGFHENRADDEYKVKYSWGFEMDGHEGAIWDWKGSYLDKMWSAWGPREMFVQLFGEEHVL